LADRRYYFCVETGEARWDAPPAPTTSRRGGDDRSGGGGGGGGGGEWTPHFDASSGETYYFNDATGESTWEDPRGSSSDDDAWAAGDGEGGGDGGDDGGGWREAWSDEHGAWYWHDERSGESRWDPPPAAPARSQQHPRDAAQRDDAQRRQRQHAGEARAAAAVAAAEARRRKLGERDEGDARGGGGGRRRARERGQQSSGSGSGNSNANSATVAGWEQCWDAVNGCVCVRCAQRTA